MVTFNDRDFVLDIQLWQWVAMDPENGKLLWQVADGQGDTVAFVRGDKAYQLRRAIRFTDTEAEQLWSANTGGRVAGAVYFNDRLYFCTEGKFQCRDAKTGEFVYRERTPDWGKCYSSPLLNGNRIYFVTRRNGTFVVRASDELELLAHNKFASDESIVNASPAVSGNRLIIRSNKAIYCIGE